ncbi:ABC transporter permease [Tessaracoccus sp. HDW20]|uniref:ABC transporter permease n=1 Tax=Tessaracoccus coleopterorum TaxID=2714950 RepID=UPI0018D40979|nr:ABC transporter permease [Tessaracoccus coleopterorum]NHB84188.1 ABC transporter permease [Tessaracoccus coleopterorum]
MLHRRRATTSLLTARGMSPRQLRGLLAVEGVTVGIPAAFLGLLAAVALVPGPSRGGAGPPASRSAPSGGGAGLGRRGHPFRAPGARRRQRQMAAGGGGPDRCGRGGSDLAAPHHARRGCQGVDLLGAAAPVLLALLACLLVLRVYPARSGCCCGPSHGAAGSPASWVRPARCVSRPAGWFPSSPSCWARRSP